MKTRLKKILGVSFLLLVLAVFIGFVEKKHAERKFAELEISIKSVADVYFVEEKEIVENLEAEFPLLKSGVSFSEINLNQLERKVEAHPFVKNAEVFSDQKGNIRIEIEQHIPMARIVRPRAADGYISTEGLILPTSPRYTTRVLVLHGAYAESLLEEKELTESHEELLELLKFIHEDEFWNAQLTELEIEKESDIKMHQQVGKQVFEFGDATEIEEKFSKINLFYEEILPSKGWNAYSRVNVKYKGQIVCE
ncbi:cell division protein FtsQ/DivIB [Mongoliibacter ruber]|uniref:Cell division protein FtsQ n=1 Tax=Mongoliibacter ruber TaxID=1750599 RepID=A0A2T0WJ29_9BACT|nr:cell division protein [Mongoliibacter ruber]PRY86697.1 cell division protein FtsQ [Mongoliibacter ruber]